MEQRIYSTELKQLSESLSTVDMQTVSEDEKRAIMDTLLSISKKVHELYQIGIVTALSKEFAAVTAMLDDPKDYFVPGDPNGYSVGTVPFLLGDGNAKHHIVTTLLPKMGNNSAASAVANLIRSFPNVTDILMVGIAGGIPQPGNCDKHVRLGDVVISRDRGVLQYDMKKLEVGKVEEIRDASSPPSARMIRAVNMLESRRVVGEHPWESYISRATYRTAERPGQETDILHDSKEPQQTIPHPADPERREGQPKLHYAVIGSANTLLKRPELRDQLGDRYGICAIEMEGSGIADGTWIQGAHYLLIRGICDYCDENKNNVWQGYAAVAAAAYARSLLERIPIEL